MSRFLPSGGQKAGAAASAASSSSAEKYEVNARRSKEPNYGSVASLINNEVGLNC